MDARRNPHVEQRIFDYTLVWLQAATLTSLNNSRVAASGMSNTIVERRISCPFCAESMHVLLDLSAGDQSYIEDCQVCCQPMQVSFVLLDIQRNDLDAQCRNGDNISLRVECGA